jgi:hypothetical protein
VPALPPEADADSAVSRIASAIPRPTQAQAVWNSLSEISLMITQTTSATESSAVTIAGAQLRIPSLGIRIGSSSHARMRAARSAAKRP